MKHIGRAVKTTQRDRDVVELCLRSLEDILSDLSAERFKGVAMFIRGKNLAYGIEALRWERANGTPWNGGDGIRVLAERGDRDARRVLAAGRRQ